MNEIEITELSSTFEDLDRIAIKHYIVNNLDKIKITFLDLDANNTSNLAECIKIIKVISGYKKDDKSSPEIQFIITNLAYFFKNAKNTFYVTTCINYLSDSLLRYRLKAWHKYKSYKYFSSHINLFSQYLDLLSKAQNDEFEDYTEDVLVDLHDYYKNFSAKSEELTRLFTNLELIDQYPLLREYLIRQDSLDYRTIDLSDYKKIYTPTDFSDKLFSDKFIDYIKYHNNTVWNETLLGYSSYAVRSNIINFGQANFDENYEAITPREKVMLYCYFNMRKHYYSTKYLLDSNPWIALAIRAEGKSLVVDVGCGPATSGIAIVDHLLKGSVEIDNFYYVGIDCYNSMLEMGNDIMDNAIFDVSDSKFLNDISDILPVDFPNLSTIFINTCYLFASPTLDPIQLAQDLNEFLIMFPDNNKFLLFQNTTEPSKNKKYLEFKANLVNHEVLSSMNREVSYNNSRNSFYTPVKELVYFEIIKF